MPMPPHSALARRDLNVVWHPCTQMRDHESVPMIPIRRGEGVWLEDFTGKRYLDASGGAAVSCLGHSDRAVIEAVQRQLLKKCIG